MTIDIANEIALDEYLSLNFTTYIPSEICEVKGVAPIASAYTEQEIFIDGSPKNLAKFGPVADYCRVAEVKRFTRKDYMCPEKILKRTQC